MSSGAFVQAFRAEADAAAHDALVELYVWVNSSGYGRDPALVEPAEAWAARIEDAGLTQKVLEATADHDAGA